MKTTRSAIVLFSLMAALLLRGCIGPCYQDRQEIWLNPDGTGKIAFERKSAERLPDSQPSAQVEPTTMPFGGEPLLSSPGVRAWAGCKLDPKTMTFTGTAYFDDLSKVELNYSKLAVRVEKTGQGNLAIRIVRLNPDNPTTQPGPMTDAEVQAKIKEIRGELDKDNPTRTTSSWNVRGRHEFLIHLPGKIVSASNLKVLGDDRVSLVIDFEKLEAAMNRVEADDAVLTAVIRAGETPDRPGPVYDGRLCKELFGVDGPVQVVVRLGDKPLFNYQAEVAAAGKDWYPQAVVETGWVPPGPLPPDPAAGTLKLVEAVASTQPGQAHLRVRLESPHPFHSPRSVEFHRVVDGAGDILLPARGAARCYDYFWPVVRLPFPDPLDLPDFRVAVISDGPPTSMPDLDVPTGSADTLKEVYGVMEFVTVQSVKKVNLGTLELGERDRFDPVQGKALGFRLMDRMSDPSPGGPFSNEPKISVRYRYAFDKAYPLERLEFIGDFGSSSAWYDPMEPTGEGSIRLPAGARKVEVIATLCEGARVVTVPFRFTNIKLPKKIAP